MNKKLIKQILLSMGILIIGASAHLIFDYEQEIIQSFINSNQQEAREFLNDKKRYGEQQKFLEEHQEILRKARATGMDNPANRIGVTEIIEKIGDDCYIQKLDFQIHPHKILSIPGVVQEKIYTVMPVDIKLSGIIDKDIYEFFARISNALPGYVVPLSMDLKRKKQTRLQRFYGDLSRVKGHIQLALVVREEEVI